MKDIYIYINRSLVEGSWEGKAKLFSGRGKRQAGPEKRGEILEKL